MVVLSLLFEAPMHPYLMQQRIKERGKDQIANVAQPNSVYQTIERLRREGLIAVRETSREERRPERTVYEITDEGRRTLYLWVRTMLSAPEHDFPDFPAALSVMMLLEPEDVRRQLEARAEALARRLVELDPSQYDVPRLFLVEDEYRRTMIQAELDWVRSLMEDLRAGRLTWSQEWLRSVAEALGQAPGA
jgi:DNA-binding PadR family transcriptional regulator